MLNGCGMGGVCVMCACGDPDLLEWCDPGSWFSCVCVCSCLPWVTSCPTWALVLSESAVKTRSVPVTFESSRSGTGSPELSPHPIP